MCESSAPIGCVPAVTSLDPAPSSPRMRTRRPAEERRGAAAFSRPSSRRYPARHPAPRESRALRRVLPSRRCFRFREVGAVTSGPGSGRRCLDLDPVGSVPVSVWSRSSRKRHLRPACPRARLSSCVFIQRASSVRCSVTSPPVLRSVNAPDVPVGDADSFRDVTRTPIKRAHL